MSDEKTGAERRQYVRVNSNIPVKITIPNVDGEGVDAQLASVTRNVSLGGVLIEFAAIREEMWTRLKSPDAQIILEMFFPEFEQRISAYAEVKWIQEADKFLAQYASIGLNIIEDKELNPRYDELVGKLRDIVSP